MGQLGHKWVNLSTNGSTWAQIGRHGAQLVKLMVQLSKIPAQRAKLGFLWPNFSNPTIYLIPQFLKKSLFYFISNFSFVIFSDKLSSKTIHASLLHLIISKKSIIIDP